MFCDKVISPFKITQSLSSKVKANIYKEFFDNYHPKYNNKIPDISIKYKVSFSVKLSGNRAYSDYQNMLVKEIKK